VFWLFDRQEKRVIYASPAFETVWGRPVDTLYRDYGEWGRSVHPEDRAFAAESFARIAESGGGEPREYRILRPDGEVRWISDRGFAVRDEAGRVVRIAGIAEDITERKSREEEHRRLESRVQHAQKLESLGVLAGGIAHDFNNLLMGILGNADVALARLAPESSGREPLVRIKIASQRASELTNQMLAYSGRTSFQAESVDLNRIVEEMTHLLRAVISKKARLELELATMIPPVRADAAQLRQIVMNLITNASDAVGGEDGVVRVTTDVVEADRGLLARCDVGDRLAPGSYVSLEVADTGSGMNEATRQRMFDPFFTTKFTGRGLGLAAVLGIVRGHEAAMRVESAPGRGTRFTVLFPASAVASVVAPAEAESESGARVGATILVVDDEPAVREVALGLLEAAGYRVVLAADGHEGVEALRKHGRGIDLVLLDMTMPGLSGEEALEEMRKVEPGVRVLLSSGYTEPDTGDRFSARNLAGFIQKPYGIRELRRKVETALADLRS
jgi:PAS domain S-box-containing protein